MAFEQGFIRPSVFVGSSTEGKQVAEIVHKILSKHFDVRLWSGPDFFRLTYGTLESLISALESFDFAVLIFTPDDETVIRKKKQPSFRDNMVFEAGLSIGKLGRDRTFIISQSASGVRVPTDLAGITLGVFSASSDEESLEEALEIPCHKIRLAIQSHEILELRSKTAGFTSIFGALNEPLLLVCSNLAVNPKVRAAVLKDDDLPVDQRQKLHDFPLTKRGVKLFLSADELVGASEVRAVAHIARLFSNDTHRAPVEVTTDEEVVRKEDTNFIAFGAFNNLKAREVFGHDDNRLVGTKLFHKNQPRFISKVTGLPVHGDLVRGVDYGVILKMHPPNFSNRTWFVCGGLGEWGTSGAAYFLSKKWGEISKALHGSDAPFAALVKVKEPIDESATLEFVATVPTEIPAFPEPIARQSPYSDDSTEETA